MELWQLILLFMGIFLLVVIMYGMARSKKPLKSAFAGVCRGLLAFGAVNLTGLFTGISLPVSVLSLGWSAVAGIPGVITLVFLNHLLK